MHDAGEALPQAWYDSTAKSALAARPRWHLHLNSAPGTVR